MGDKIVAVLGGIGLLIFVYLLVSNGDAVVKIANSVLSNGNTLTKTLQGR